MLSHFTDSEDFAIGQESVVFPAGSTVNGDMLCILIAIINDTVLEGDDQMFRVSINASGISPSGCVEVGPVNSTTFTIADDSEDG